MDSSYTTKRVNWYTLQATVIKGRMIYKFYAFTHRGLCRKIDRYFK